MKISRISLLLTMIVALVYFIMAGCKKKDDTTPQTTTNNTTTPAPIDSTHQTTRSTDATDLENESSLAMDDANTAMSQVSTTRTINICGLSSIDSANTYTTGIIVLHFDGTTNCSGKIRGGSISIQLPLDGNGHVRHFSELGVTAKLTFTDYKITYVSTGHSIKLNGTHTVKNLTGNAWVALAMGTPVQHQVRADIHVTYENGSTATWKATVKRTFTYTANTNRFNVMLESDSTSGTYHLAFFGTNRFEEDYFIDMPTAFTYDVSNQSNCIYKPLTGEFGFHWSSNLIKLTYGLDYTTGNMATGCPNAYKFEWEYPQGTPHHVLLHY